MTKPSSLLRSNLIVAAGTALSRVSGLLRVFAFGYVIGQSTLGDAYKIANETPNIVYELLLGGVLSATLVPLFSSFAVASDSDGDGDAELAAAARHDTNAVITVAAVAMLALTALAVVAAPLIFRVYTLSPASDIDVDLYRSVGTTLTRIFVIQILFYGLTGLANAYLNSRRRFLAAAWSPILPNLIIVATLLSLPGAGNTSWTLDDVVNNRRLQMTLGCGATLGIASMAFVVIPAARRAGLRFRPVWDLGNPAVRRLARMGGWTFGFVAANQVALAFVRNTAQSLGSGAASSYVDAFTFYMLPHGLLAVSIATTFQPDLARAATNRDRATIVSRTTTGIRVIAALTAPAAAALVVLGGPIIGLMGRGQFDADDVARTATALTSLGIGLVGFSVFLFTLRAFYAHHDTRTPFVLNVGENLVNVVLAILFARWWGLFGLGLSYSVAYLLAAWWALRVLAIKVPGFPLRPIWSSGWRIALAAVLMAEAMWWMSHRVTSDVGWAGLAQLFVAGTAGLVVYVAVLIALGSPEVADIRRAVRR